MDGTQSRKSGTQPRPERGNTGRWKALLAGAMALVATAVIAHPYPPYWDAGTGAAIHFQPVSWPAWPGVARWRRQGEEIRRRGRQQQG